MPDVKIVWSELLQRRYWHTAREGKAMEKARKRVNLAVKNIVLGVRGYVIKHNTVTHLIFAAIMFRVFLLQDSFAEI